MAPSQETHNDSSLSNDNTPVPQSNDHQPRKKKISWLGSGGLDTSDTSRLSSSAYSSAKSRARRSSSRSRLLKRDSKPEDRHAALDDEEGHAEFFLTLLYESLDDSKLFFFGSVGILVVWSVLCALFSEWLHKKAYDEGSARALKWLDNIENCSSAIRTLGTLFVFTLVFRFQTCYGKLFCVFWTHKMIAICC
jgi:hypothetical protein